MPRSSRKYPTIGEVADALDRLAPPALAQEWDNVGLLIGARGAACRRMLLCIDLTPDVLAEAVDGRHDLVLAYHPPLFRPIKTLLADSREMEGVIHQVVRAGLAVYSPHTALDAAPGGTNDVMAELCGLTDVEPFEYIPGRRAEAKVVTFVPAERLEAVAEAMAGAGAGRIGDYEYCSFRLEGTGTFFGTESTHPRRGEKGSLQRLPEVRLEMVCPLQQLREVTAALRASHPYEEAAFDVYPLLPEPVKGIGRVGQLPAGTTLGSLGRTLTRATGSAVTMLVGDASAEVRRAAVCVGAAGRLPLEKPACSNSDVVVTGEIRHHDALALLRHGRGAVALGHWESERPVLAKLAGRLGAGLAGVQVEVSKADTPPFTLLRTR